MKNFTLSLTLDNHRLAEIVENAGRNLWSRFISPDSVLYDYAGPAGEVILPTPEECRNHIPNGLGWWTPVENGGFFTGMYLVASCDRYRLDPSAENREKIRRLVGGVYKLQDVGNTPGFVARGVGTDGRCHYAASSNDQVFPWFLGLWRYLQTDIPSEAERTKCIGRMSALAEGLARNNWNTPGDMPDFDRGRWLDGTFCSAVHLASVTRIMYEITRDEHWRMLHYRYLNEPDPQGVLRRERIAAGMDNLAHWSAWFNSNVQYALRELYRLETDPALRSLYRRSLRINAQNAVMLLPLHRQYDWEAAYSFTPDWHRMMPPWRKQRNGEEAQALAMEQLEIWNRACPAIAAEKAALKPAVCAGYIIVLSEEPELLKAAGPLLAEIFLPFHCDRLGYSTFFYVENVIYELWKKSLP